MLQSVKFHIRPKSEDAHRDVEEVVTRFIFDEAHENVSNYRKRLPYYSYRFKRHPVNALFRFTDDDLVDGISMTLGDAEITTEGVFKGTLELGWAYTEVFYPEVAVPAFKGRPRIPYSRMTERILKYTDFHIDPATPSELTPAVRPELTTPVTRVERQLADWQSSGLTPHVLMPEDVEYLLARYLVHLQAHFPFLDIITARFSNALAYFQWRVDELEEVFPKLVRDILEKLKPEHFIELTPCSVRVAKALGKGRTKLEHALTNLGKYFGPPAIDPRIPYRTPDAANLLRLTVQLPDSDLKSVFRPENLIGYEKTMVDWRAIKQVLDETLEQIPLSRSLDCLRLLCAGNTQGPRALALALHPELREPLSSNIPRWDNWFKAMQPWLPTEVALPKLEVYDLDIRLPPTEDVF